MSLCLSWLIGLSELLLRRPTSSTINICRLWSDTDFLFCALIKSSSCTHQCKRSRRHRLDDTIIRRFVHLFAYRLYAMPHRNSTPGAMLNKFIKYRTGPNVESLQPGMCAKCTCVILKRNGRRLAGTTQPARKLWWRPRECSNRAENEAFSHSDQLCFRLRDNSLLIFRIAFALCNEFDSTRTLR